MHGCLPDQCYCVGKVDPESAFKPDEYLKVMTREVKRLTKKDIKLV